MVWVQIFSLVRRGFVRTAWFPLGENADELRPAAPVCYALPDDLAHPGARPFVKEDRLAFQRSLGYAAADQVGQPVLEPGLERRRAATDDDRSRRFCNIQGFQEFSGIRRQPDVQDFGRLPVLESVYLHRILSFAKRKFP